MEYLLNLLFGPPPKISAEVEDYLASKKDKVVEVCVITSMPFADLPRQRLQPYHITVCSDMSTSGKYAAVIRGKADDIRSAAQSLDFILEVQRCSIKLSPANT